METIKNLSIRLNAEKENFRSNFQNFLNVWAENTKEEIEVLSVVELHSINTEKSYFLVRGEKSLALISDHEEGCYFEIAKHYLVSTSKIDIEDLEKIALKIEDKLNKYKLLLSKQEDVYKELATKKY
jgi:hypothetical protein